MAVIVPVLNRPERVQPLLRSLEATYEPGLQPLPVFVCSDGDAAEIRAVQLAGYRPLILTNPGRSEYARKTNLAAAACPHEWLFLGADDLDFHPGWVEAALTVHEQTGALVIGTDDRGNPAVMRGRHATHSLVHRDYIQHGTIDEPGKLLHEGYGHQFTDTEFVETARARGLFAFAKDSVVTHLHPFWHKGEMDDTYRKGFSTTAQDRALYNQRRKLWTRGRLRAA